MIKKSRSKYFEYLNDYTIESSVLSGAGVQALVPASWEDKEVKVVTSSSGNNILVPTTTNDQDYFYTRCKKGRSRGYVSLPAFLSGMKVIIQLVDTVEEEEE